MKALAVLAILLGVIAVLSPRSNLREHDYGNRTIALNYAIYRNAAFSYALKNKPSGVISSSVLDLPQEWKSLRLWTARMEGGRCYVYGPASADEIAAAWELFQGSFAIGRSENGHLTPDGLTPLPAFIPADCLASVIEVTP